MKNNKQEEIDIWLQSLSDGLAKLVLKFLSNLKITSELEGTESFRITGYDFLKLTDKDYVHQISEALNKKGIVRIKEYFLSDEERSYIEKEGLSSTVPIMHDVRVGKEFNYALSYLGRRFGENKDFYNYDYDTKTLQLKQKNGKWSAINFRTKRGKKYQSSFLEILLEHWERNGEKQISRAEVIRQASKLLNEQFDNNWFKNTFRHFKDTVNSNKQISYSVIIKNEKNNLTFKITNPIF